MPIIASAIKRLRQIKKRSEVNREGRDLLKKMVHDFRKNPTPSLFVKVVSRIDKAAKTKIIHANKASRLKSRLSKLLKK